jgi:hypothetical protein
MNPPSHQNEPPTDALAKSQFFKGSNPLFTLSFTAYPLLA